MSYNDPMNRGWYPGGCMNCPGYPLQMFHDDLIASIRGEKEAISTYTALVTLAPDDLARSTINEITNDERKHLQMFTQIYMDCFCGYPDVGPQPPLDFDSYQEGLMVSFAAEIDAAHFYRDIQLKTCMPTVHRTFYEAMIDEMEHAMQFNHLLILARCHGD